MHTKTMVDIRTGQHDGLHVGSYVTSADFSGDWLRFGEVFCIAENYPPVTSCIGVWVIIFWRICDC